MNVSVISFTLSGIKLSLNIKNTLLKNGCNVNIYTTKKETDIYASGINVYPEIEILSCTLNEWTNHHFKNDDLLVFIGACGIAIRSIAPFIKNKCTDAAVVVSDDKGQNVISLLSGHLGGANYWTNIIADGINANPVITTASDIHNTIAIDMFAKKNNLYITNMKKARFIEAAILDKKTINFFVDNNIEIIGNIPEIFSINKKNMSNDLNKLFNVIISPFNNCYKNDKIDDGIAKYCTNSSITLFLIPKIITLGIGCKRGTMADTLKQIIKIFLKENNLSEKSIKNIATIDLKKDEYGLTCFAKENSLPILYYSADELNKISGNFTSSDFVKNITGTDNICERAAVKATENGKLIIKKHAENGVTIAAAIQKGRICFEYK